MAAVLELVSLDELTPAGVAAWAELAVRAEDPNPFLHPDFVLAAARAQGTMDSVHLARVRDGDGLLAALPVRPSRRWRRLPLPGTLAWTHEQCFLGTPLVAPGTSGDPLAVLVDGLTTLCDGSFVELDLVTAEGRLSDALDEVLSRRALVFGRFHRAALERRPAGDYLDGRLRGKHRRSLRRLARELGTQLGGELQLVERAGARDAVETFMDLEAQGWKGQQGTALASDQARAEFFRHMCHAFAERGALQLLFLEAGGRTVAARANLRAGDAIFCFKIAYDESLSRYSPGMQLELRMIEHFHADASAQRMDSCADPRAEMFNRLWPDRRELRAVLLPTSGPAGRLVRPVLRAVTGAIDRRRGYAAEGRPTPAACAAPAPPA